MKYSVYIIAEKNKRIQLFYKVRSKSTSIIIIIINVTIILLTVIIIVIIIIIIIIRIIPISLYFPSKYTSVFIK